MGPPGKKGSQGPAGLPGSIIDMCRYLPKATIGLFRFYDEENFYAINDPLKDLVKDKSFIKGWRSHSQNGSTLTAKMASKEVMFVEDGRYALGFKKSTYVNEK